MWYSKKTYTRYSIKSIIKCQFGDTNKERSWNIIAKIINDKYYTPPDLAKYCVDKTEDIIGKENITEYIEPSAGGGVFLNYLDKPYLAYDIEPEDIRIQKQDFLTLNIPYKKGRCIIGNPPFGIRNVFYRKFYNKATEISDYIAFIASISQLNNTKQLYKFDLIYSEDLGSKFYSGINLHCCFNIYKRPQNGNNKRNLYKLNDIDLYREDNKKYKNIKEDFMICRMGSKVWKVLDEGQILRNFKVVVHNKNLKDKIIKVLNEMYMVHGNDRSKVISTPYISANDVYKYIKEQIPEIS